MCVSPQPSKSAQLQKTSILDRCKKVCKTPDTISLPVHSVLQTVNIVKATTQQKLIIESLIDCKNKLEVITSLLYYCCSFTSAILSPVAYELQLEGQSLVLDLPAVCVCLHVTATRQVEEALREFRPICQPHPLLVFPPAHYGVANVLIKLKR